LRIYSKVLILSNRAELDLSFVLKAQGNRHKAKSVKIFFSNDGYIFCRLPRAESRKLKNLRLFFGLSANGFRRWALKCMSVVVKMFFRNNRYIFAES
jgi:hypothetical protein